MTDLPIQEPMSDMARLFQMDPNKCSDQDIMAIVQEFRQKKNLFNAGVMNAGSTKPKAAPKPKEPNVKLDLSALGLKF